MPLSPRVPSHLPWGAGVLQMGVTSLVSFHLHARLNGQYFGKYAYVEQLDEDTLKVRHSGKNMEAPAAAAAAAPGASPAAASSPGPVSPRRVRSAGDTRWSRRRGRCGRAPAASSATCAGT